MIGPEESPRRIQVIRNAPFAPRDKLWVWHRQDLKDSIPLILSRLSSLYPRRFAEVPWLTSACAAECPHLENQARYRIQIARECFASQPRRFERNRSSAGERIDDQRRFVAMGRLDESAPDFEVCGIQRGPNLRNRR